MRDRAGIAAQPRQLLPRPLHPLHLLRHTAAQWQQAAVPVEQMHVRTGPQQSQMLALPVNVDQQRGHLAQKLTRDRAPVDAADAAAVAAHLAAEDKRLRRVRVVQPLGLHERQRGRNSRFAGVVGRRRGCQPEGGLDLGPVRARPHHLRGRPVAQQQPDGVDDDRLARAGLSGQDIQSAVKTQLQPVDDGEVAHPQLIQRRGRFHLQRRAGRAGGRGADSGQEGWLAMPLLDRGMICLRGHSVGARPNRQSGENPRALS